MLGTRARVRTAKPTRRKATTAATTTTLPDLLHSLAALVANMLGIDTEFQAPAGLGEIVARFLADGG